MMRTTSRAISTSQSSRPTEARTGSTSSRMPSVDTIFHLLRTQESQTKAWAPCPRRYCPRQQPPGSGGYPIIARAGPGSAGALDPAVGSVSRPWPPRPPDRVLVLVGRKRPVGRLQATDLHPSAASFSSPASPTASQGRTANPSAAAAAASATVATCVGALGLAGRASAYRAAWAASRSARDLARPPRPAERPASPGGPAAPGSPGRRPGPGGRPPPGRARL